MDNTLEHIVTVVQEICEQPVMDDGLRFDIEKISAESIIHGGNYEGVRVRFRAYLGTARIPMQVDIGFGDPVIPATEPICIPPILDFPPPQMWGYSRESAIAEKLQSMVRLGEVNSRMKDFFDVWLLAHTHAFSGPTLSEAIRETFRQRRTALITDPVAFGEEFTRDPDKQVQWVAFLRRHNLSQQHTIPRTLSSVTALIATFLRPVLDALVAGVMFKQHWPPGGPWSAQEKDTEETDAL
jgi:hypothetical protein